MAKAKDNALTVSLDPSPEAGKGVTLLQQAQTLIVSDKPSHTLCLETIKGAKQLKRTIEEHYAKLKRPVNDARNVILQMEKDHLAPVNAAIETMERTATTYAREQERREREEQDRIRREAEEQERQRREQEAAESEETALRLEASSNVLSDREQEFVILVLRLDHDLRFPDKQASAASAAGYKNPSQQAAKLMASQKIQDAIANAQKAAIIRREAEAKKSAPIVVETAPVESQIGTAAGVSMRSYYRAEPGFDLTAALQAIVADSGDVETQALVEQYFRDTVQRYLSKRADSLKQLFPRVYSCAKLHVSDKVAG